MKRRFKTAFILGAGLGKRLLPLTQQCPKPLLEIKGRPIITYVMDHLLGIGIERFIINIHHLSDLFFKKFPEQNWRGVPIIFRYEPILLETGGGLKNIEDLLAEDDAIICYNGDVISNLSLKKLISAHDRNGADITLALRSKGNLLNVEIDEVGNICDIRNILGKRGIKRCQFTGIYALETSFLKYLKKGEIESIIHAMIRRINEKPGSIRGVIIDDGQWLEVGSIEAYRQIIKE